MQDLGTIPKNAREEIRVTAETFHGCDIVSLRVWYQDAEGAWRPGKQGLAFRRALLGEVLDMLRKAVRH